MFPVGNLVGTLFNKEAAQQVKEEQEQSQKEAANEPKSQAENTGPRDMAVNARTASRALQNLSSKQREQLLHKIADNLLAKEDEIMRENNQDCQVTDQDALMYLVESNFAETLVSEGGETPLTCSFACQPCLSSGCPLASNLLLGRQCLGCWGLRYLYCSSIKAYPNTTSQKTTVLLAVLASIPCCCPTCRVMQLAMLLSAQLLLLWQPWPAA